MAELLCCTSETNMPYVNCTDVRRSKYSQESSVGRFRSGLGASEVWGLRWEANEERGVWPSRHVTADLGSGTD